jgi:hypothetical protein
MGKDDNYKKDIFINASGGVTKEFDTRPNYTFIE